MINDSFRKGLHYDIEGDYELAIKFYEKSIIEAKVTSVDLIANLSCIYWLLVTDNNFPPVGSISDNLRTVGLTRYKELIDIGVSLFPKSTELHFWSKYYPYRMYYSSFTFMECQTLYNDPNLDSSLVPSFYLHLYDEAKYKRDVTRLVDECFKKPTAKNNYIISVANL